MPRILFVSMPGVTHAAQWVSQLNSTKWDVHFFPSHDGTNYLDLYENVTLYSKRKFVYPRAEAKVVVKSRLPFSNYRLARAAEKFTPRFMDLARWLAQVIDETKPDFVHSMEMQRAAYLVDAARKHLTRPLPPWIVTPWGSDLYLYRNLNAHVDRLKSVLQHCQYFWAECQRDYQFAAELGFKGKSLSAVPASGGFQAKQFAGLAQTPPSQRKYIMIKGYQGFVGRALNAFTALKALGEKARGYTVVLYLSCYEVDVAAELFTKETGIKVITLQFPRPYEEIQRYFGESRLHIGLSISDGMPTSVIESMSMGTFPIQSDSSCAHEWIQDGRTGMLVPADDSAAIAKAIDRALTDDAMVDAAAKVNREVVLEKMEYDRIREKVLGIYDSL